MKQFQPKDGGGIDFKMTNFARCGGPFPTLRRQRLKNLYESYLYDLQSKFQAIQKYTVSLCLQKVKQTTNFTVPTEDISRFNDIKTFKGKIEKDIP